jgi:hypothetical protein
MVQALAFAEIFLGLILADAGYKGVSLSAIVRGEAGKGVEPLPLGSPAASTGSPGASSTGAVGDVTPESEAEAIAKGELLAPAKAMSPREYEHNKAFGPQPINSPNSLFGSAGAAP